MELDVAALRLRKLRVRLHVQLLAVSDLLRSLYHLLLRLLRLLLTNAVQLIH